MEELKKDPILKDKPIIMLSALSQKTFFHSQKVLNEYKGEKIPEPDAYIEKPPEPDELLEAIQNCLVYWCSPLYRFFHESAESQTDGGIASLAALRRSPLLE